MKRINKVFVGEIKEINEKDNTLVSFVSTGAVDRMGDVIEPEGIDLKNYRKNPVVLWAHDYGTPPIGKSLWIKKQDGGVVSKMQFANTAFAQEIFQLYKEGIMKAFSIGFIPVEAEPMDKDNTGFFAPKRYKKTEMLEYSAVPVPANPEALAMAMQKGIIKDVNIRKAFEDSHIDDIETSEEVEEKSGTDSTSTSIEINQPLDDLLAENKNLQDRISGLEKEVQALKYDKFVLLQEKQKKLSEITTEFVAKEVGDEVRRVVRKLQGKID